MSLHPSRLQTAAVPHERYRQAVRQELALFDEQYRRALGRTVLIGLEVLVAATIIKTITVKPTLEGVGLLVVMIAIRTILGWTMVLEMNGRWPWQRPRPALDRN